MRALKPGSTFQPISPWPKLAGFIGYRNKYKAARKFVEDNIDMPTSNVIELTQPVKIKVTGYLFFDKRAHGHGHSKNGIEIHPILEISPG